ncbi:MAG: hypothetical protein ACSLEN_07490 [Candidatus Malihini olakiniferum]
MPRLIDVDLALDLILTGQSVKAQQSLKLGMIDDAVPNSILLETAPCY